MKSGFEQLTSKEAKELLVGFLNFGTLNSGFFYEQFVKSMPSEFFGISSLSLVLGRVFQSTKGYIPIDRGPKWINQIVSSFDSNQDSIFLLACWYLGETFVRSFPDDQLEWNLGDASTLYDKSPVVSGFLNGSEMLPMNCLSTSFRNEKSQTEHKPGIQSIVDAWIALVPSVDKKTS